MGRRRWWPRWVFSHWPFDRSVEDAGLQGTTTGILALRQRRIFTQLEIKYIYIYSYIYMYMYILRSKGHWRNSRVQLHSTVCELRNQQKPEQSVRQSQAQAFLESRSEENKRQQVPGSAQAAGLWKHRFANAVRLSDRQTKGQQTRRQITV